MRATSRERQGAALTAVVVAAMALAACGSGSPARLGSSGGKAQAAGLTVSLKKGAPTAPKLSEQAQPDQQVLSSAVDSASARVSDDESRLQGDVSALAGDDASLTGDEVGADADLAILNSDLNTVQADVRSNNGNACADAAVLGSNDPSTVGGDEYNLRLATLGSAQLGNGVMNAEAQLGSSDEQAAKTDLAKLVADRASLGHAAAADPAYPPFDGTAYQPAETAASTSTEAEVVTFNADVVRVEDYGNVAVNQGAVLVTAAQRLC